MNVTTKVFIVNTTALFEGGTFHALFPTISQGHFLTGNNRAILRYVVNFTQFM